MVEATAPVVTPPAVQHTADCVPQLAQVYLAKAQEVKMVLQERQDRVVADEPEGLLPLPAPVPIDAEVPGEREEPRDQRERAVVTVEVLEGLQEDLLGELLRVFPVEAEVIRDRVDLLAEVVDELTPGVVFPLPAAIYEALFFGAHVSSRPK